MAKLWVAVASTNCARQGLKECELVTLDGSQLIKVKNEYLHFYDQHLRSATPAERKRRRIWVDEADVLLMPVDEDGLYDFYELYSAGTNFSRGICGTHWGWPDLLNSGRLVSAGDSEKPDWTNCNGPDPAETRWLPAYPCEDLNGAAMIALGNLDEWTRANTAVAEFPVGITATIAASATGGPVVCWGTAGEIQIDGPLQWADYTLTPIWFGPGGVFRCSNLNHFTQIWPHRPYRPTKDEFDRWSAALQDWIGALTVDPDLVLLF